jgi:hypothetical protein
VLARVRELRDYPACLLTDATGGRQLVSAALADGVNWFPPDRLSLAPGWKGFVAPALPPRSLALECGRAANRNLLGAVADDGRLALFEAGAAAAPLSAVDQVGAAFELVDLDGDGAIEVVTSAWRAPGQGDALAVFDEKGAAIHRGIALRGGVAAIAAGDFNGDGAADVAAFVRLVEATRGDLWVMQ